MQPVISQSLASNQQDGAASNKCSDGSGNLCLQAPYESVPRTSTFRAHRPHTHSGKPCGSRQDLPPDWCDRRTATLLNVVDEGQTEVMRVEKGTLYLGVFHHRHSTKRGCDSAVAQDDDDPSRERAAVLKSRILSGYRSRRAHSVTDTMPVAVRPLSKEKRGVGERGGHTRHSKEVHRAA